MRLDNIESTSEMTEVLDSSQAVNQGALAIFPERANVFLMPGVTNEAVEKAAELSERFGRYLHLCGRR